LAASVKNEQLLNTQCAGVVGWKIALYFESECVSRVLTDWEQESERAADPPYCETLLTSYTNGLSIQTYFGGRAEGGGWNLSLHTQMLCSIAELSIGPLLFNSNSEKITPGNATLNPQKYAHAADDDKKAAVAEKDISCEDR